MLLLVQCILGCILFTLVLIPAAKNPINYLSTYPPEVQKAVKALPQYKNLPSVKRNRLSLILLQGAVFIIVGVIICLLAGITGFIGAFTHMYIFFLVINIYDLIVIDWLLFCRKATFRIPGTEHLDKAYKDYYYHFKVFLRGILFGLAISFIVAGIVFLIGSFLKA